MALSGLLLVAVAFLSFGFTANGAETNTLENVTVNSNFELPSMEVIDVLDYSVYEFPSSVYMNTNLELPEAEKDFLTLNPAETIPIYDRFMYKGRDGLPNLNSEKSIEVTSNKKETISLAVAVEYFGPSCSSPDGTETVYINHAGAMGGGTDYWLCCNNDCEQVSMSTALDKCREWAE